MPLREARGTLATMVAAIRVEGAATRILRESPAERSLASPAFATRSPEMASGLAIANRSVVVAVSPAPSVADARSVWAPMPAP